MSIREVVRQAKQMPDEELLEKIKLAQSGDLKARDKILESYYRLIYALAKNHARNEWEVNEFFQVGVLEVLNVIRTISTYMAIDDIRSAFYFRIDGSIVKNKESNDRAGIWIDPTDKDRKIIVIRSDNIIIVQGKACIYKDPEDD